MSFSNRETEVIRTTWTPFRSNPANWPRLFLILFSEDPDIQKQFKSFADVPKDELMANKRLKAHAASVISLISGFVDFLDDLDTMVEMIRNMATRHYKRKIPLQMFDTLGVALVKWLKEIGGEAINEEAVNAWTKLYSALISIVKERYSELDKSSS